MIDVIYDGTYLNARLNSRNYKAILQIAEQAEYSEYLHSVGVMSLPPTKFIARQLFELGLVFDGSAKIFLDKAVKKEPEQKFNFRVFAPLELRPYQEEGVGWLCSHSDHLLLGDEMGLGKSVQIAAYLHFTQSFPTLIVCPASLKLNWEKEINLWTKQKCQVLEGLIPYPIEEFLTTHPVVIINYDILGRKDKAEIAQDEKRIKEAKKRKLPFRRKRIPARGWIDILKTIPFKNIICDESQFIGKESTARTTAIVDLCRQLKKARRIFLSGTPYTAATEQFFTTLNLISHRLFPNRWRYKMQFCDPVKTPFGWDFRGLSNGDQLHNLVKGIMLRRLKKDVMKDLPPKVKVIVPMKVDPVYFQQYAKIERELLDGVIKDEKQTYHTLRQQVYYTKIEACCVWIKEYFVSQDKLVVFCYHREAFRDLMNKFKSIAVGINGETPSNQRQGIVERFQKDKKVKLFIGQIRAAGVGITLPAAPATCFIEFGDTAAEHLQGEDRVHRETQTADSVMAFYLIAPNTIDEDAIERIKTGYANQKQVLDGEKNAQFIADTPSNFARGVLKSRQAKLK